MTLAEDLQLRKDWAWSLLLHAVGFGLVCLLIFLPERAQKVAEKINIEIHEVKHEPTEPVINVTKPKPIEPPKAQKRVFGLNKNTLTSSKAGGVEVKAGNTVAKAADNEIIDPKDADSLPTPVDEYLISQMPKLKNEVKIPYPAEARAKNIEGPVVMDILIDGAGKVRSAKLISGPGFGLNEAALKAIYSFEFSAALVDGKPVAVSIRYAYRFVLN